MEYQFDSAECPKTCMGDPVCIEPPGEGCVCKSGFVLSDGRCIEESECGCEMHVLIEEDIMIRQYVEVRIIYSLN